MNNSVMEDNGISALVDSIGKTPDSPSYWVRGMRPRANGRIHMLTVFARTERVAPPYNIAGVGSVLECKAHSPRRRIRL